MSACQQAEIRLPGFCTGGSEACFLDVGTSGAGSVIAKGGSGVGSGRFWSVWMLPDAVGPIPPRHAQLSGIPNVLRADGDLHGRGRHPAGDRDAHGGRALHRQPRARIGTGPVTSERGVGSLDAGGRRGRGGVHHGRPECRQLMVFATYKGDASFAASPTTTLTETVNPLPTTTTVSADANPSVPGQTVDFTAVVGGGQSPIIPTGPVTFTVDGVAQAPVPLTVSRIEGNQDIATFSTASL